MKDTLKFFPKPLFWFSPSETTVNNGTVETIIILASYISAFLIVFPLKYVILQLHCLNILSLIIEFLQPVLHCFCQAITQKNENKLTLREVLWEYSHATWPSHMYPTEFTVPSMKSNAWESTKKFIKLSGFCLSSPQIFNFLQLL